MQKQLFSSFRFCLIIIGIFFMMVTATKAQFTEITTNLPGLKENLVTERILTPLDFEKDYNSFKGTGFSVEPIFTQSAWFRPHNKSEDITGLYLVGAGTHPGAGLPGVVSSAKVTTDIILGSTIN